MQIHINFSLTESLCKWLAIAVAIIALAFVCRDLLPVLLK